MRLAVMSGAFLTFAIVTGEYTIANFLFRPAFGPYLSLLGRDRTFEPAAVNLISFGLTCWPWARSRSSGVARAGASPSWWSSRGCRWAF
ncbi:MAG: hypothetical protein R3C32_00255 [Chloroflexota bacterium]